MYLKRFKLQLRSKLKNFTMFDMKFLQVINILLIFKIVKKQVSLLRVKTMTR